MDMDLSKLWETVDRGAWCARVHGVTERQTRLSNLTVTTTMKIKSSERLGDISPRHDEAQAAVPKVCRLCARRVNKVSNLQA